MPTFDLKPVLWIGAAPTGCDVCRKPITTEFVDGATVHGPWAHMCPTCHPRYGRGLGPGLGQRYVQQDDGSFRKTEG